LIHLFFCLEHFFLKFIVLVRTPCYWFLGSFVRIMNYGSGFGLGVRGCLGCWFSLDASTHFISLPPSPMLPPAEGYQNTSWRPALYTPCSTSKPAYQPTPWDSNQKRSCFFYLSKCGRRHHTCECIVIFFSLVFPGH